MTPRRIVVIVVVVIVVTVNREINVRMGTSDERWGVQYKKQGTNRKETAYERGEGEGAAGEGIKKHWRRNEEKENARVVPCPFFGINSCGRSLTY
jgi:hypothetical protein